MKKDSKKEFTFGQLPNVNNELKKKEDCTLKTGKWEKAEPAKPSKADLKKLEQFQELKRKRHERELDIVKKCAYDNNLISPACSPTMGNHGHPDQ